MFKNPCAHKKLFFTISIVLIVVSVLSMVIRGFNFGIDFTGGTTLSIEKLPEGFTYSGEMEQEVRELILNLNPKADPQIQKMEAGMFIKTAELTDEQLASVVNAITVYFTGEETTVDVLATEAPVEAESTDAVSEIAETEAVGEEVAVEETETSSEAATEAPVINEKEETAADAFAKSIGIDKVNGTASANLISSTLKAVLLAIILMLVYIAIRFDFKSGVCAVMALTHDVILMFGFYSVFYLTMNTSFVAAVLTIIGYSINATIVVFDRVRENNKMMRHASWAEKADKAIKTSYTRTIYSSLTTLFTIGALYILGVSSIKEFALPIIVGIACGAYSSLFVAPTFWEFWKESAEKSKAKK